jgi:parvulin-like peptidyl-prolyl isomerase
LLNLFVPLFAIIGTSIFVYQIAKERGYKSREREILKLQFKIDELRNQIAKEPKQELQQETISADHFGVKLRDEITQSLNSLINKLTKGKGA